MDSVDLSTMPRMHVTQEEARRAAVPPGQLSALLLSHGTMALRWYAPSATDDHTPHDKDEVYVVASGTAFFVRSEATTPFADPAALTLAGEERAPVQAGDALFVPAGTPHRFEAASPDFALWVIFYGPEGGEPA